MARERSDDPVEQILEGLGVESASGSAANDAAVDDILAGLGLGEPAAPAARTENRPRPESPAERPSAQKAAPGRRPAPEENTSADPAARPQAGGSGRPAEKRPAQPQPQPAPRQKPQPPIAQDATGEIRLGDLLDPAPARPSAQKPARSPAEDAAPTREVGRPSVKSSLEDSLTMDDEFTRFFTESVAVVPGEEEETGHVSLWQRLRKGRGVRQDPSGDTVMLPDRDEPTEATGEINLRGAVGEIKLKIAPQRVEAYSEEEDATRPIELDREPDDHTGGRPRLFGSREPEEEFEEEPPRRAEYETLEDGPAVQTDLESAGASLSLRVALTGILGAALLYLGMAATLPGVPAPAPIDPTLAPGAFLAVNLILLLAALLVNFPTLTAGLAGLVKAPTPDTLAAFAGLGALVQLAACLIAGKGYDPAAVTLFAGPAALLLAFNAAGRRLMNGVVSRNFQAVTSGLDREAAYLVHNRELTARLAAGTGEPDPALLISRPTELMRGFMRQSFSARPGDALARKLAWGQLAAGIAALAGGAVIGRSPLAAVSSLAGALCLAAPVCATLVSAVPSLMLQKSASRVGAVVPGWSAQEELGLANMILVGARDLFPAGCVRLHGIKTFEKERIDLAILYAASILVKGCDTLRDVFLAIIQNKTEMLFPVENLSNEPGLGFTGWVQNNRVLVGNRELMRKHGVDTPSRDYESRYTRGGRELVYLAVSGRLFGMFLVSYKANPGTRRVLHRLHGRGISVLVKSDDFTLNSTLVSQVYNLPEGCIKVLSASDLAALAPATAYQPASDGCMLHIGSFASFVGGMDAAAGAVAAERSADLVQAVSVAVGCLMAVLLAFTGGLVGLALPAMVLYHVAWAALTLALPLIRKY